MPVRDLNKSIFGFLFHTHFLIGLFELLLAAGCAAGVVFLFRSSEPLALRLFGCLIILLGAGSALSICRRHVRIAWKDWRAYRKGE